MLSSLLEVQSRRETIGPAKFLSATPLCHLRSDGRYRGCAAGTTRSWTLLGPRWSELFSEHIAQEAQTGGDHGGADPQAERQTHVLTSC